MLFAYFTPALLGWEAFVALALWGFGLVSLRVLGRRGLPPGVALCAGVAAWLLVGGVLNVLHLATAAALRVLLGLGVVLFFSELGDPALRARMRAGFGRLWPRGGAARVAAGALILWFGLCFAAHLGTFAWNRFDDLQGYTAFADKAAALGGLTPDPFSERRVTSGVGGALFLNVTMLAGAGNESMDFLEGALGLGLLLALLGAVTRRFGLRVWGTLGVYLAAAVFTLGRANISSVNLSAALFLALFLLLCEDEPSPVLAGLLAGAAFTLKSSNIPFCGLLLLGAAAERAWRRRSARPLGELLVSAGAGLLVAAPWAFQHRLDEGTALFPSLGRGFHVSAYGFPTIAQTVPVWTSLGASVVDFVPPLLAGGLALVLLRGDRLRGVVATFLFAAALAAPLFAVAVAGEDLDRFLLPMLNLAALLFLCVVLGAPHGRWRVAGLALVSVWAAGFVVYAVPQDFYRDPGDIALLFGDADLLTHYEAARSPAEMAGAREVVRRAQAAVPAGATLLEEVQEAYGFDFRRNPVLLADYPGMASPKPGLPLDGTSAEVRAYLLGQGVHYVMLDRGLDRAQYAGAVDYGAFRRQPQVRPTWRQVLVGREVRGYSRMEFQVSARTQALLGGLATPGRVVYDRDGLVVVALDRD